MFVLQVIWAGPNSRKGKENKDNENKSNKVLCDRTSEGTHEVGESSRTIVFERKRRNCCEGDYSRKPAEDAKPTVHFLLNEKG